MVDVMQRAVATCPKVNMGCERKGIPSLLHSGSQVTLICQRNFKQEILPHIIPSSREKAKAHQLFQLTAANNGKLPVSMYVKLDLHILGIVEPMVGVLITQEPTELLDEHHKTILPGIINWKFDKTGLSGVCSKLWIKELGIFCLSDGFKSTAIFTALCISSQQSRWNPVRQCDHPYDWTAAAF